MRTSKTSFKLQKNYYPQFAMGALVFFGAFLLSVVVASVFAPVSESLAESKTDSNDVTGFYVTITSSDNVALSVDATPVGQLAAAKDTINVKTNAPLGYKLLISANNTNLSSNNAGNTGVFSASVGTSSNPVTLSPNTWGYSMDEKSLPIPSTDSTWIGITTTPTQVASYTYATDDSGNDHDIYYGINATTSLPTDTYSTTVTYTAIAEGITETSPLMQNYTYAECNSLSNGSSTTLMDVRNGANYRITKLADGNCWMTQNLRLDGGITLTSADTNLPTGTTVNLPANIKEGDPSNATDLQIIRNLPGYDGNLYNWCAATLNNTNCSTTTAEATQDICPKGWRLPSNSGSFSYVTLNISTVAIAMASPYFFTKDGGYESMYVRGGGTYWTSTPYGSTNVGAGYHFYFASDIQPHAPGAKFGGRSLRCVFKGEDITRLTYMQDITTALCQNTPEGVTTSLLDRRGYGNGGSNKTTRYGVIKAKDGNCWMADNLNLYNVNISYAYSDFTNGSFKIPASEDYGDNDITVKTAYIHVASGVGDNADKTNKYGTYGQVYYNWVTTAINSSTSSGTVSWSICPKNWRLPANGDANTNYSYQKLFNAYNLNTTSEVVANSELGIKNTGCWYSGHVTEHAQGTGFRLWTGTAASAGQAYSLGYNSDLTSNISSKTQGFSVRCVAR